jgi:hypothetical protein
MYTIVPANSEKRHIEDPTKVARGCTEGNRFIADHAEGADVVVCRCRCAAVPLSR